jgi:glycerol uptake facilitator-like aquaporin
MNHNHPLNKKNVTLPSFPSSFSQLLRGLFYFLKVPAYVACQVIGATLAAGTIRLLFQGDQDHFTGTMPAGSNLQSFVVEFIITFYLMFIISGVATDNRAVSSYSYPNR